MKQTTIKLEINHSIAKITFNRPTIHNAFDDLLIEELTQTLISIEQYKQIRVVLLTSTGTSFCAGADLNWMKKMAEYSRDENLKDAQALAKLMEVLNNLSKPTIALVQGPTYGGGVGLVACCDIAIAAHEANFCLSEVKLGLVPAVISPYVIDAIGARAARRYFLTAEKFDAEAALRLGLIHQIVPSQELETAGTQLAKTIISNSPNAVTTAKKLISKINKQFIDKKLIQITAECIADIRSSAEGKEGVNAFLQKRKPSWPE